MPDRDVLAEAFPHVAALANTLELLDGRTIVLNAALDMQRLAEDVHTELLKKADYNAKLGLA